MKLRLTTERCGPGLCQYEGDEIEVGPEEGRRLVASGQAEPLEPRATEAARAETATTQPPEHAARFPARPPRRR